MTSTDRMHLVAVDADRVRDRGERTQIEAEATTQVDDRPVDAGKTPGPMASHVVGRRLLES